MTKKQKIEGLAYWFAMMYYVGVVNGAGEKKQRTTALDDDGGQDMKSNSKMKNLKRTKEEQNCLNHLRAAWYSWLKLEHKHPNASGEFCGAIHVCQNLIGLRQLARVDKTWHER